MRYFCVTTDRLGFIIYLGYQPFFLPRKKTKKKKKKKKKKRPKHKELYIEDTPPTLCDFERPTKDQEEEDDDDREEEEGFVPP